MEEMAVFKGDRLVGWLTDKEIRGYMYTTGKARQAQVTVPFRENQSFQIELLTQKIRKKVEIKDGQPVIKLKLEGEAKLNEAAVYLNLSPEQWNEMNQDVQSATNEIVKDKILSAVKAAQETYRSDIFGFGQLIYRTKPELWKQIKSDWESMFPEIKVEVEADITYRRAGESTNPPYPQKEEYQLPVIE